MILFLALATVLIGLAGCVVTGLRRASRRRETQKIVFVNGENASLAAVAWAVASTAGADGVRSALAGRHVQTAEEAAAAFDSWMSSLSDEQKEEVRQRIELGQRAQAERALWDVQNESLAAAASAGMIDSIIIAAGENPDWSLALVDQALGHVDVSQFLIGHALGQVDHHYWEVFHHQFFDQVVGNLDQVAGHAIDAGVNVGLDAAGHGIAAIADAHIPVVTVVRSFYRASKSSKAGLEQSRVNENLGWDLGAKGGGIASGAAAGAAIGSIVPGLGTAIGGVIGGVLGGLLGSEVAEQGKERHLRSAMAVADRVNTDLGQSIGPDQWRRVALTLSEHLAWLRTTHRDLGLNAKAFKKGLIPPLRFYILSEAVKVGGLDVQRVTTEYADWLEELRSTQDFDSAYHRGVFALTRPELHDRLGIEPSLVAKAMRKNGEVGNERRKLQLARGH